MRVEAHVRSGLPGVTIVGLPGAAVREARERVRSGAASSGLALPTRRITVNLSPGEVPKDGSGFDLPIALATLAACGQIPAECVRGVGAVGEMSLDGIIRPTRGLLSVAETATRMGVRQLVGPMECLPAAAVLGLDVVLGVRSLTEAVAVVTSSVSRDRVQERGRRWLRSTKVSDTPTPDHDDLAEVVGHEQPKRALEIVAAGGHHLLMVGSPGAGKTMLARRLPGILPPLSPAESLEVTRIWSAAAMPITQGALVATRPFRAPHHTASRAALVGGGVNLRPGEVSLAHRGILFLDELPEFSRDALEALREPLADGRISVSRRSGTSLFPAACTLVAAMNPCPCGYLGHMEKDCRCQAAAIDRYRARLSGPLLDRVDALIEVPPLTLFSLQNERLGESSSLVRARVVAAREFRRKRQSESNDAQSWVGSSLEHRGWDCPPAMSTCLATGSRLNKQARDLMHRALAQDGLSGRAYTRVIGLARTIADLDQVEEVDVQHVAEALSLRLDYRRVGLL